MRLGGRIQAAVEVLEDLDTRHRPVPDTLRSWGLSHRFAGSGDRAAISNLVLDVLRQQSSHSWLMDSTSPIDLVTSALLRQWHYPIDKLADELEGDQFAPEIKPTEELTALMARDLTAAPEHVQADIPEWCVPAFKEAFGDSWMQEARALAMRAPLDLRVNTLRANRTKVLKAFKASETGETRMAPHGIRIPAPHGPKRQIAATGEVAFAKGWFEIQDEGSQIAALLTAAAPGQQVLDFCAGGGGKTLAMAAEMENRGQIHAYDSDRKRLAPMIERLRRAGVRNVQIVENQTVLNRLEGKMDRVLIDAPCTGTGTWRRRPDAKWRLSQDNIDNRTRDQDQVLDQAARFVKPDGMLVYVTCSLLPVENTARIEAFLARNEGFQLRDPAELWAAKIPGDLRAPLPHSGPGLLLSPARTATDGFYIAVLSRKM